MGVRSTSRAAFHSIQNLPTKREQVLNALRELKEACNLDIAYKLKWPINRVTPRMNELVKDSIVIESCRKITPRTGKRVIFWKENNE